VASAASLPRILLAWSSGKDGALALHALRAEGCYEVAGLLTTFGGDGRVSHHGVPLALVEQQARSLGVPLIAVTVSEGMTHEQYGNMMRRTMEAQRQAGIIGVAYGDLFLEDLRRYREDNMRRVDMEAIFPLWMRDTQSLARDFLALGFRAVLVAVDGQALAPRLLGRVYDESLLAELPAGVDPCGENGEFHTFTYDGPGFGYPVMFDLGAARSDDGRHHHIAMEPIRVGR